MHRIINFLEKIFSVITLLVFTDVLSFRSWYTPSENQGNWLAALSSSNYGSSPLDPMLSIIRWGIYGVTIFLILARWKSVVFRAFTEPFLWLLLGMALTSFIWSDFPSVSLRTAFTTLASSLVGVYLSSRYSLKEQLQLVAWALGIAALLCILYTLVFPGVGIEQDARRAAWRGTFSQKNSFGLLILLAGVTLLLTVMNNPRYRYLGLPISGISIVMLWLSNATTSLLLFITLMILVPIYSALRWSDILLIPLLMSVVLILGGVSIWFMINWESFLTNIGRDISLTGRTDLWKVAIDKIGERPWLGYGYQAFWQEKGEGFIVRHLIQYNAPHAHNGFIELGLELGLLGVLFFVLSILLTYKRAVARVRLGKTSEDLWPLLYLTFLLIYNQTEVRIIEPYSYCWILQVSITLSLKRIPLVQGTSRGN